MYNLFCKQGRVEVRLKCGAVLTGKVHSDWETADARFLLTTMDLKDVYKQFGTHDADRNKAVVVTKNHDTSELDCCKMNYVPFRAAASVHHFNKFARLIWALGVVLVKIPWVNYSPILYRPRRFAGRRPCLTCLG